MSESMMLIKQLEYCLNSGFIQPATILVSELIHHKAQLKYAFQMEYKCSSHENIFNKDFISPNNTLFYIFSPCLHAVCFDCIGKYIFDIFNKVGLAFRYVCPGCC